MKAVILAAGRGTRLGELTKHTPKPLVPVAGRPILDRIIETIPSAVTEIIIVIGYYGEQIQARYGAVYAGRKITYVEQTEQRGTAHALLLCRAYITGRFLFMFADDLHGKADLQHVTDYDRAMLVTHVDNPRSYGVVQMNTHEELLTIIEKPDDPPSNLISTGVFVLDEHIFEFEPTPRADGELCHTSMVRACAKQYPIKVLKQEEWIPISTEADVKLATKRLASEHSA